LGDHLFVSRGLGREMHHRLLVQQLLPLKRASQSRDMAIGLRSPRLLCANAHVPRVSGNTLTLRDQ
jgi:hypothetical protein